MKKIMHLVIILFSIFVCGHAFANVNKKAQAYYFAAEEAYHRQYYDA